MHVILWRFRAAPGREAEFEAAYGDDGTWVRFFRAARGFLGSELMRGTDGAYLTIDRWVSEEAHREFREAHADAVPRPGQAARTGKGRRAPVGRYERDAPDRGVYSPTA
jgi:heme-degrading monooxygenase HmoA